MVMFSHQHTKNQAISRNGVTTLLQAILYGIVVFASGNDNSTESKVFGTALAAC